MSVLMHIGAAILGLFMVIGFLGAGLMIFGHAVVGVWIGLKLIAWSLGIISEVNP